MDTVTEKVVDDPGSSVATNGSSVLAPTVADLQYVYTIIWKDGSNLVTRNFYLPDSDLPKAIDRAKLFCEKLRLKFIHCQPFLMNMVELEKRREREGGMW